MADSHLLKTRSEVLRRTLEEEIYLGKLAPGTHLDEIVLAERFSVSRTPVREALLYLASAGLVEIGYKRGARVASFTIPQILEMLRVLAHMEDMCARLAVSHMTARDLAALTKVHLKCRSLVEADRVNDYYALARDFHHAIYAGTGNAYLAESTRNLRNRIFPYLRFQLHRPGRAAACFAEQELIHQAVVSRDPEAAAATMRAHIDIQIDVFSAFMTALEGTGLPDSLLHWERLGTGKLPKQGRLHPASAGGQHRDRSPPGGRGT